MAQSKRFLVVLFLQSWKDLEEMKSRSLKRCQAALEFIDVGSQAGIVE